MMRKHYQINRDTINTKNLYKIIFNDEKSLQINCDSINTKNMRK